MNHDSETPLIDSIEDQNTELAKKLLSSGSNPNEKDYKNKTALMYAAESGNLELVDLLLTAGARVESREKKDHIGEGGGMRAIHYAASSGKIEVVERLLAAGAKFEVKANDGYTPFYLAAIEGATDIADLLLNKGADINNAESGSTALHGCIVLEDFSTAMWLIERGVDFETCDALGGNALAAACSEGHEELVKILIAKGAKVNSADEQGSTVLMSAVAGRNPNVVHMLLNAGASTEGTDFLGNSALDIALDRNAPEIAEMLRSHGAKRGDQQG